MDTIVPASLYSDGSDRQEWAEARSEARRAMAEAFHNRNELLELSSAASGGPIELARRMRETEFGSRGFSRRQSFASYFAHLFGESCGPNGMYAQSYAYELQAIHPFIRSVH
jgi:hypothetical protein